MLRSNGEEHPRRPLPQQGHLQADAVRLRADRELVRDADHVRLTASQRGERIVATLDIRDLDVQTLGRVVAELCAKRQWQPDEGPLSHGGNPHHPLLRRRRGWRGRHRRHEPTAAPGQHQARTRRRQAAPHLEVPRPFVPGDHSSHRTSAPNVSP